MKLLLKGIIPPMVTPLLENGELDSIGLKKLIEHLITGGVHGIFLLGTNGEGPSLSYHTRKQLIVEACEIIGGRVPVLVGVTDTSIDATLEISNFAKSAGADVLVVAPPYYFPISDEEMNNYLRVLTPQLSLPFLVYNIPSCTKLHLSLNTIKIARELGAIGVKDSSGDVDSLLEIIEVFKDDVDFSVIAGNELFLADTILKGAHGGVSGGANFYPKLFVELYNACVNKEHDLIRELSEKVREIDKTIYKVDDSPTASIKGIKCALAVLGICEDYMARPLKKINIEKRATVKGYIKVLMEKSII